MQIKQISIDQLKPYENNPRINDNAVEAVAASIAEFGFKNPIIIDSNFVIIAGHTRLKAAKKLGMECVPCIVADDLTDEQIKAFRIVDNKTAEFAEWDLDLLESELAEINNIDMSDFGFEIDEIEPDIIEDDVPEVDEENQPTTKLGDIWQLGNHRLICGDSTDEKTIKKLMNGRLADLALTDPPYNVNYQEKEQRLLKTRPNKRVSDGINVNIENDNMSDKEFYNFLINAFTQIYNNIKAGGACYVCHASMESINFLTAFRASGFKWSQLLIWVKNQMVMGRSDYQWKHELIIYGWKEGAAHYYIDDRTQTTVIEDKPSLNKMSKKELIELCKELLEPKISTTVINEDRPVTSQEHPTMKPIKLLARLIKNSSKKGEIVLDSFGGSGSTLIACEQLERICYTCELDEKYCDVIIKRWESFTGEKAVLLHD